MFVFASSRILKSVCPVLFFFTVYMFPYLRLQFGIGFGHSDYQDVQIFALSFQPLSFLLISENPVFESLVLLAVSEEQ